MITHVLWKNNRVKMERFWKGSRCIQKTHQNIKITWDPSEFTIRARDKIHLEMFTYEHPSQFWQGGHQIMCWTFSLEDFLRSQGFNFLPGFKQKTWKPCSIPSEPRLSKGVMSCSGPTKTHRTSSAMSSKSKSSRIFNVEKALATWAEKGN